MEYFNLGVNPIFRENYVFGKAVTAREKGYKITEQRLVQDIIKFDQAAKDYGEYQDYERSPTKSNASEFIDAFVERNADRIAELDKLVSYIAERPGVENWEHMASLVRAMTR